MKNSKVRISPLIFTITLFTISCGSNVTVSASTQDNSSIVSTTSAPHEVVSLLTYQEALEQMYGQDVNIDSNNEASILSADGTKYHIEINIFSCYWDISANETCLVFTDRSRCLGCNNYIDGATFSRTYRGWNLNLFRSNILEISTMGKAPKGKIIRIGPQKYAAQFNWEYRSGTVIEHLVLISVNSFDVVLDIVSRGEKWISSDKMEYGWNSNLDFRKTSEDNNYYDLIVTYYGDIKGMPYSEFYTFSNGKYDTLIPKEK